MDFILIYFYTYDKDTIHKWANMNLEFQLNLGYYII